MTAGRPWGPPSRGIETETIELSPNGRRLDCVRAVIAQGSSSSPHPGPGASSRPFVTTATRAPRTPATRFRAAATRSSRCAARRSRQCRNPSGSPSGSRFSPSEASSQRAGFAAGATAPRTAAATVKEAQASGSSTPDRGRAALTILPNQFGVPDKTVAKVFRWTRRRRRRSARPQGSTGEPSGATLARSGGPAQHPDQRSMANLFPLGTGRRP